MKKINKITLLTTTTIFALNTPYFVNNFTNKVNAIVTNVNTPLTLNEKITIDIFNKIEALKKENTTESKNQANIVLWLLEHRQGYAYMDQLKMPLDVQNWNYFCDTHGTISLASINKIASDALNDLDITYTSNVNTTQILQSNYVANLQKNIDIKIRLLVDNKTPESIKQANAITWMIDHKFTFGDDLATSPQETKDWNAPIESDGKLKLATINEILNRCLTNFNIHIPTPIQILQNQKLPFGIHEKIVEWRKQFDRSNLDTAGIVSELQPDIVTTLTHVKNKRELINIIIKVLQSKTDTSTLAQTLKNAGNDEQEIQKALIKSSTFLMSKYPKTSSFILTVLIDQNKGWDAIRDYAYSLPQMIELPIDYNVDAAPPIAQNTNIQTSLENNSQVKIPNYQQQPKIVQNTNVNTVKNNIVQSSNNLSTLNDKKVETQNRTLNSFSMDSNKIPIKNVNLSDASKYVRAGSNNNNIFTQIYYSILILGTFITLRLKIKKFK